MGIISIWTKVVTDNKVIMSGFVTVINILIWYYVLETVINDVNNFTLILAYSAGCAVGTMISTAYFRFKQKKRTRKTAIIQGFRAEN